jgi:hypothetical protein
MIIEGDELDMEDPGYQNEQKKEEFLTYEEELG